MGNKPGTLVLAKNAVSAAAKVILRIASGQSYKVGGEELAERLRLCYACKEHFNLETRECFDCGCPVHSKTILATESCGIGKWQALAAAPSAATGAVITGADLLEYELEIRELLPGTSNLAQAFNRFRHTQEEAGCTSCRERLYHKDFEKQLSRDIALMSVADIEELRKILPNKEYISLSYPYRWDEILEKAAARA